MIKTIFDLHGQIVFHLNFITYIGERIFCDNSN